MNNKNTNPRSMLLHIAEEDIATDRIDIWPGLQKTLLESKKPAQQGVLPMSKALHSNQHKVVFITGLLSILTLAAMMLTPGGKAFAQQILGYFIPADQTSFPVPEVVLTAQSNPDQVYPTEAPTPTPISASFCLQTSGEEKYRCEMAFLEGELGDWIKVLPYHFGRLEYVGYRIDRIPSAAGEILTIDYGPAPYGAISVMQGQGDFPQTISSDSSDDHWSDVPESVIQAVTVNGQPGEYVEGAFVQMVENGKYSDNYTWNSEVPMARLRWKENNTWFQVLRPGVPEEFRQVIGTKEGIVLLAEALVRANELTQ